MSMADMPLRKASRTLSREMLAAYMFGKRNICHHHHDCSSDKNYKTIFEKIDSNRI
jgi:hypothetical protein